MMQKFDSYLEKGHGKQKVKFTVLNRHIVNMSTLRYP